MALLQAVVPPGRVSWRESRPFQPVFVSTQIDMRELSRQGNNTEDVRGLCARTQRNVIAAIVPGVLGVGEQVVDEKALPGIETERGEVDVGPARLAINRIEIDDDENRVCLVGRCLRVADQLRVVSRMEAKGGVRLQCRVEVANLVELGDEWNQRPGGVSATLPDLVLLAVHILL